MGLTFRDKAMFTKAVGLLQSRFCTNTVETLCTTWCTAKCPQMMRLFFLILFGCNAILLRVLHGHASVRMTGVMDVCTIFLLKAAKNKQKPTDNYHGFTFCDFNVSLHSHRSLISVFSSPSRRLRIKINK